MARSRGWLGYTDTGDPLMLMGACGTLKKSALGSMQFVNEGLQRVTSADLDAASTVAADIMKKIRQAIITGQLESDQTYTLDKIAAEMHVSRTPVREALIRLADDGMVEFSRGHGVR